APTATSRGTNTADCKDPPPPEGRTGRALHRSQQRQRTARSSRWPGAITTDVIAVMSMSKRPDQPAMGVIPLPLV
ncbi:hypothetical protein, partial [Kineococcus arenarius]|uniref:hypothetical protein n=1 Tax=unclassified Kineococcus TaxID=2621656 RepID=UPI003D7CAA45